MSAPICLRCFYGAWQRSNDGLWNFKRKPSDLGYTIQLKPAATFEALVTLIRSRYKIKVEIPVALSYHHHVVNRASDATRTPPTSVTTTADVALMIQLHSSNPQLNLCVSSGPEDVARYQFLTNTPFPGTGLPNEFSGLHDFPLIASKSVLEEIFTPDELVSIYRGSFKIGQNNYDIRAAGVSGTEYGPPEAYEDEASSQGGSDV